MKLCPGKSPKPGSVFTAKRLYPTAQGKRSATLGGGGAPSPTIYPEGVAQIRMYNPFGVKIGGGGPYPRVRCATLGCGVKPLRGRLGTSFAPRATAFRRSKRF